MNFFLAQTIIIARNGEPEPWMQILVLAVMAVFWAIGGILKKKQSDEAKRQPTAKQPTSKLRSKLLEGIYGPSRQSRAQAQPPRSRKVIRQQPPEIPTLPLLVPQARPKPATLQKPEAEPGVPTEAIQLNVPAEAAQLMESLPSLLDFDEPDSLIRAILNYEVLGKPLSLRYPSQDIIGLCPPSDHLLNP